MPPTSQPERADVGAKILGDGGEPTIRNRGRVSRRARWPAAIVPGAVVIAGTDRFWSVVRIEQVDDDGQVRFVAVPPDDPLRSACSPLGMIRSRRCTNDVPRQR